MTDPPRNVAMAQRIERTPVAYPFRFVVAGDSGAWPNPTAEAIYAQLVRQVAALDPPPVFFANLGDFAGPGTSDRHEHYLRLVEPLSIPDICVVGNHDLDDESGPDSFARFHGPVNFGFGYGHTRFVAIHAEPGVAGMVDVPGSGRRREPRGRGRKTSLSSRRASRPPTSRTGSSSCTCPRTSTATSPRTPTGASNSASASS
jgi:hypothetical protein